ncbi:hypothetical protein ACHWQZ_G002649 [Mnemiopsis leidyi]
MEEKYSYEKIQEMADNIKSRTSQRPKLGIICGSGLGGLADLLTNSEEMEYTSIPGFPVSTVKGHGGKLVFGKLEGVECICMKGRFHFYEGYPIWKCAAPVQVMKLLGVKGLIVTNAAGGISSKLKLGDLMLITDHINLPGVTGNNPLRGPNDERFGPRFPSTNAVYSKSFQNIFKKSAEDQGLLPIIKEGTYLMSSGPTYESPAELNWFKTIGADAVGMSTVPETVVASWCGMVVLGISLITNICILDVESTEEPTAEEVYETAKMRSKNLQNIVRLTEKSAVEQNVWNI